MHRLTVRAFELVAEVNYTSTEGLGELSFLEGT
jgi:hypothetical protein